MIYLTTGANGAGKTLLTLKDVRAQQLKENRPVYYHGFDMDEAKAAEFGWQKFDPKKWQDLPDGSICIMDECQNEFPLRRSGAEVPDYVQAIAQHRRRRGFDFWMICPHPSLIDVFVRRLIDKPSWHRHLKRAFGADVVSVLRFASPDMKCEEPGAGARGEVTMVGYSKEVYGWYRSASLHTGKNKIPRAVYVLAACAVFVPAALYFAVTGVYKNATKHAKPAAETVASAPGANGTSSGNPNTRQVAQVMTADEYIAHRVPRLPDFPHTAPAYDDTTKPTEAPYPAACVEMGKTCKCYTQQATLLQVSGAVCLQIVRQGFFMDWKTATKGEHSPSDRVDQQQARNGAPAAQQDTTRTVPFPMPAARPEPRPTVGQWAQGLAARNAQVRSALTQ